MASKKNQTVFEKIRQGHGLSGTITVNSTKSNQNNTGKQSNSASPTRTNDSDKTKTQTVFEKIRQGHGLIGTSTTTKQPTNVPAEIQKAYTSNKNKTTIKSNLSDSERKTRIKEVEAEIKQLNTTLYGLGRAAAYGNSDYLKSKREETEKRKAELSAELKTLQRVGTFTASELKQFEIDDAKAEKAKLGVNNPTARVTLSQGNEFLKNQKAHSEINQKINQLEREKAEFKKIEELEELNAHTTKITSNKDFEQNSKYSPRKPKTDAELKAEGYKKDATGKWYKPYGLGAAQWYSGEDSELYTYINDKSKRAGIEASQKSATGQAKSSYEHNGYATMTEAEIGAFNYLYHQDRVNGTKTAEEYLNKIAPLLEYRALENEAKRMAELSKESPGVMSVVSLGTNLANAAMFPAKAAATATGNYSPMLDMYGNQTQAIRGAVSEDMGTVGSLLYNAGMSIGDMGVAMVAGGGNAKVIQAIMSSAAGSSTISQAKNNGASDGKALVLGLGSAAIEWATEKYSVEAILKKPESILGYLTTNTLTEATEEGASNIANVVLDGIVSEIFGDRNEIEQRVDYLMLYEGKTAEEALNIAFNEKLQSLGEDVLVGGITGAGMSSAVVAPNYRSYINQKKTQTEYADSITKDDKALDLLIEEGKAGGEGSSSAKIAAEVEQAKANGTLTTAQVKKLIKANDRVIQGEENAARTERVNSMQTAIKDLGYGEHGTREFTDIFEHSDERFEIVRKDFQAAYELGYTNPDFDSSSFTDSNTQRRAFNAGKLDYNADLIKRKAEAKNAVVYGKDSGFYSENAPSDVKQWEIDATNTMAKMFHKKVAWADGLKGNAELLNDVGVILINRNFERYVGGRKVGLVYHSSHEMAIHEAIKLAPKEMMAFANDLYRYLSKDVPQNRATLAMRYKSGYEEQDVNLSVAEAIEEVAAYNFLVVYNNDERAFAGAMQKIAEGNNQAAKSGMQKFTEILNKILESLKKWWNSLSGKEKAEAKADIDELTRLKDMFENAIRVAAKNAEQIALKNEQKAKDTNAKNTTNTDADTSNVSFELKGIRADGIEVYETSKEVMQMPAGERKKQYIRLMSNEYLGRTARFVRNGHTYYAEFDRSNLGKPMYGDNRSSVSGKKALTRVGADGDIFDLVENSTYSHSTLDVKNHKNTDYFDYFIKTVQIDNKVYDLLADVKKQYENDGGYVYTLVLTDNTKIEAASTKVIENDTFKGVETASASMVSQNPKSVKKNFSLKGTFPTEGMNDSEVENARNVINNLKIRAEGSKYIEGYASYTADRMEREISRSSASHVPDYARSYITWVSPIDFVYATTTSEQFRQKLKDEAGALNNEKLKSESQPIHLTVDFETGEIVGHEGRHRMLALQEAGIDRVAIIIDALNDDRHHTKPIEFMPLTGQSFQEHRKGVDMFLHDMLPLSQRYADVAKELFTNKPKGGVQYSLKGVDINKLSTEEQAVVNALGKGAEAITNANGEMLIATNKNKNTITYSLKTYNNGGKAALEKALKANGHTSAEIAETLSWVDDAADYLTILAAGYAKSHNYTALSDHLIADVITNVKTGKQVISSIVNNGDYPVNIDLALICKKRVAYMNLMNRLIDDGVFDQVNYGGEAIAKVNELLRTDGFETACLGCFVESRRLQFQAWAETIVSEWNTEVDKRKKNAGSFNFAEGNAKLTDAEMDALAEELKNAGKKNAQGNLNLGKGSVQTKMGRLLDKVPSLQKHLTVADLLKPEGLTALRAYDSNLFSIVKSRYGAASPKIVQDYNPYASEIAMMTFASVKSITSNAVKGADAYRQKVVNEMGGKPVKEKGETTKAFNERKAEFNAKVEDEAIRRYLYDIGGARIQSFSDFMIENVFDYIQIFADLSAKRLPLHGYTKEIIALRLFGMTGAKWNGSWIAHVDRNMGKEYAGLLPASEAKDGNAILVHTEDGDYAIGFDDYARYKATNKKTFIQSIGMKDMLALQLDSRYSPYVGSITIGVSDKQILAMLDSPLFRFVIPYHSSGMLPQFAKLVGVDLYNDYTDYQNTTVNQWFDAYGNPCEPIRNAKNEVIKVDTSYNFNAEVQKTGDAKKAAANYLKWCEQKHPVYDGKKRVGYATFTPKFSDSPYGTDFTKHENYYKLLEDFNVYDNITEESAVQGAVTMTFPSEQNRLSASEMEAYKGRLRETGVFSEKEIEKYSAIADKTFKELIADEVQGRAEYQKAQSPKWENTVKNVEEMLLADHKRSTHSLKGLGGVMQDYKDLAETVEHLKAEFELTKFAKADQKKLTKMTRDILKEYNSKADFDETFKGIDELYVYMANGEDGHPAVWEDVYSRAYNIAQEIVENALVVDDYNYQEYKDLRNYLRNTPMKFYPGHDSVPSSYDNFNEFRKMNMGRLKFTNDGLAIDTVYQELSNMYPEFFNEEEQMNTADQLEQIINVLDEMQPTEVNPFDGDIEQATMYLANDLTSRFFDIPQAKPTFADKAERRVVAERIKGGKKVETVREQKDAKIKKLIESQRNKTKKLLEKAKESKTKAVAKEKAKRKESLAKMSEKQKVRVLRSRIERHTSDLSKKLVNPTDNQHIPYELQGAVAKLLECINLESNYSYDAESNSYKKNDEGLPTKRTQAFHELQKVYADIASSVVVDPDLMGESGLLSGVISLADKRLVDMNSSELDTIWQAIRAIEATVSTANRVFSEGKFATILEVAEALKAQNEGRKSKTELKGIAGKGQKLATLDMLTPETYFHFLGDAGESIFRMMRNAQDKHISIMKEVSDFTHETLKDVKINSLEKTIHTVKLGGEDVQLSTAQIMELYVLMKRKQAVEHIMVGGILPDVIDGKGLKKISKTKPVRGITAEEISSAISQLTDEQKKIADELQKYVSTVLSAYGNEASMQVYNYEKFNEENYWTIRTNRQEIKSDVDKDTAVTSVANKGMTKATKPHANTSVRIGSIFDTFASHSSDMATYAAWLGTSEDVNRIRNFVFWDEGARTGTVKDILDTVHGTQGSQYLEKLLADIAIGVKGTDNLNPFDKLVGHYKAASVGANLRVIIQQPTAILRAMDMIDARYLVGTANPLKGWEKAKKYAPIAQWKDWGYFDINTGRQMKDVLFDNASLLEKTKQVGMWGASMADSLAWGQLWNAVESETKATHKELTVGSETYYETVAKRFTEIVDHTQVVDGILQRSQVMRSADNLTKMATSFMGEPTKQYNMAISAYNDYKTGERGARKEVAARLGRTALALAVAGIVNACAQSIIDAMRDDDKEEKYWERWLTALVGDGEESKWYDSNLADTVNLLNYIPFAKDVVSIMRGYDVKRMDTEAITKVFDATKNMYKAVTGTGKYTIAEASAQLFVEIARMFGLSVANVKRDVKSLAMAIAIETDNYLMQYRMEKAMLDINYSYNSKNFIDILFNAYNNDREAYETIYKDMLKSGYDADTIENGMEERMKKAEGVKDASDLTKRYLSPDDEKKYDSSLSRIKSSKAWNKASLQQQKKAKANLYEYLTSDSKDMQEMRTEARANGVDATEYTLWKLAIEMVDQPTGQKGSGSYDFSEKAEALDMLNLGDKESAYFFGRGLNKTAKEEIKETLEAEIDIQEYIDFKAATSEMKADKNAKGNSISNSKKRKIVNYLNDADLTPEEWNYFYYEIMGYKK